MAEESKKIDRRTVLQLISSGALLSQAIEGQTHCGMPAPAAAASVPYRFQFFTPEEARLLESVMEKIIPQDEHSPGAREARAVEFADLMIASGPEKTKEEWRTGARLLAAELEKGSLDAWLDEAVRNEENLQAGAYAFFQSLKAMTINGYYTSAVGIHQELRYQGNTYVAAFVGCEHREHKG